MKLFEIVMYVIILGLALFLASSEHKDWGCEDPYILFEKCKPAEGMSYRGSKPEKDDDCSTLLKKINIAASAPSKSIKWRKSFVVSVIISLLIFGLVVSPGRLPKWTTFYLSVLIGFAVVYFSLNFYDFHKYNTPREYIAEATDMIATNNTCCSSTNSNVTTPVV